MRAIIIIVVVAVLGFFGYQYFLNDRTPGDAVGVATDTAEQMGADAAAEPEVVEAVEPEVVEPVEAEAAEPVEAEAVEADANAAGDAAADATVDTETAVDDAASDAAAELLDADPNEVAAPEVTNEQVVDETPADASSVVETGDVTAEPPVEEPAAVAPEAAPVEADAAMSPAEALTPENFDAAKVVTMIEESDMSAVQKTALTAAVNAAKDNPALLEATLTRLREAMGL